MNQSDMAIDPCIAIRYITSVHLLSPAANASFNNTPPLPPTPGYLNLTLPPDGLGATDPALEEAKYYLSGIVNPVLCMCGLIGNILNIIVLTRRHMQVATLLLRLSSGATLLR